jgi:DNA polymerase-3 subunit epsilon
MLRTAPHRVEVLTALAERLDGNVFTAHNVGFDWAFVERAADRSGVTITPAHRLCTLRLSRTLDPDRHHVHRLGDVCERYGVVNDRPHDALSDAQATAEVLPHLLAAHGVARPIDLERLYERR